MFQPAPTIEIIDASGADITLGIAAATGAIDLDVQAYTDTDANSGTAITSTTFTQPSLDAAAEYLTVSGTTSLLAQDSTLTYTIQSSLDIGAAGGIAENSAAVTGTVTSLNLQVDDVDISTVTGANQALQIIDAALADVNSQRADLGAIQNRFESVISNLANVSENSSAARSRIQDADFAQETANLARAQILQQAGISVLAQANAQPQNVLALLQ